MSGFGTFRKQLVGGALTAVTGLMLIGSIVSAQNAGSPGAGNVEIAKGITARGNGEASALADAAIMQFIVRHDGSQGVAGIEPQNMMAMAGGGAVEEVKEEELQPLIEAAKSNGIADDHIDTTFVPSSAFSTPFGPGVGVLALKLEKADLKHRVKIANAITKAASDHGLMFDQIGAAYVVDDCVSLDRAAIADAAEDAHDQAELMAEVMGLTLGDLIAVDKQPSYQGYGGASGSACGSIPSLESAMETYFPSFDPNGKPEQEIYEYLTVTYAIG